MAAKGKGATRPGAASPTLPQLGHRSGPAGAQDVTDLSARVRFNPADGQVWLDNQRMLLIHLSSMASLRKELVDSLGVEVARGLLNRMGYNSGARDAEIARRIRPDQGWLDAFLVGPQLHALEGIVSVEPVRLEADVASGHFYGEFIWRNSAEVDCHLAVFGLAAEPVCWMQIGYASGYTSGFMGRPILYREVECRGAGHPPMPHRRAPHGGVGRRGGYQAVPPIRRAAAGHSG